MIPPLYLQVIVVIGIVIILAIFFHYVPFFLWLSAKVSGVRVSLVQLFLMRIRNVPPHVIVPAMIEAHKAGLNTITRDELRSPLHGRRTRRESGSCTGIGIESQYRTFLPNGNGHRPCRT